MLLRLACAALTVLSIAAVPRAPAQPPPRIVAIGDIHGAGTQLTGIMRAAGLIDEAGRWIGGTTRLVQTGDMLDRGSEIRPTLDLLMRLEDEARRAGGRVDVLFGNHEGMNVLRDLRDMSPAALAPFADARSEDRRRKAFEAHEAIARRRGLRLARDEWMAAHPPGYVEYVQALGPDGNYGRWIRARRTVLQIDDAIFMHAGLRPDTTATLDDINRRVDRETRAWDDVVAALERARVIAPTFTLTEIINAAQVEIGNIATAQKTGKAQATHVTQELVTALQQLQGIQSWALIEAEGPLWYRGLATLPATAAPEIRALLERYGAGRFVTGHTPQLPSGRIGVRFDGRAILIDTGMLDTYFKGGRPSALEMRGDRLTAFYPTGPEPLTVTVPGGATAR